MFAGEGTANLQKVLIAEDALGDKIADRYHGKTGLRSLGKSAQYQPAASLTRT